MTLKSIFDSIINYDLSGLLNTLFFLFKLLVSVIVVSILYFNKDELFSSIDKLGKLEGLVILLPLCFVIPFIVIWFWKL